MTSPSSTSFKLLHRSVQRWVYDNGWTGLNEAQEIAIPHVLAGDQDIIVSAPTAAGKTEAAFLPVLSALAESRDERRRVARSGANSSSVDGPLSVSGVEVLCISPLKALINDQFERIELMGEYCDVEVERWHGDVAASRKKRVRESGSGILIITPESLEAMMVNRGHEVAQFFRSIRYVIVDELHAFFGTPRGAQLQSILNRIELATRQRCPRIGLSATIGDASQAAEFLRPGRGPSVKIVKQEKANFDLRMQLRGYLDRPADRDEVNSAGSAVGEISAHLLNVHRGSDGLIFANSVSMVETVSDRLAQLSEQHGLPAQFFPHHGRLSKDLREDVEKFLCDKNRPTTAICTSTLELGIDVGSIKMVSQVGTPPTVSALRQRLGRCRKPPAILRLYCTEDAIDERSTLKNRLRNGLVQTVASVSLLLDKWYEPLSDPGYNYSTLVQQVLSTVAQHGGAREHELFAALCGPGPFSRITKEDFERFVTSLLDDKMLSIHEGGTLLLGEVGEREVAHYSFYAAFASPDEWRLVSNSTTLGTIIKSRAQPQPGAHLIFAGRRWLILVVDEDSNTIELAAAGSGTPTKGQSNLPFVSDEVRARMLKIYQSSEAIVWLDATANALLAEARNEFRLLGLSDGRLSSGETHVVLSPWAGDRVLTSLIVLFGTVGIELEQDGPCLVARKCNSERIEIGKAAILDNPLPAVKDLGDELLGRADGKWDYLVEPGLLAESLAVRHLDLDGALEFLRSITAQ